MKPKNLKQDTVFSALANEIRNGTLPKGSRLPALTELERICGVSRWTLLKALNRLEDEQLIIRRTRSGIYVKHGVRNNVADPPSGKISPALNHAQALAKAISRQIQAGNLRAGEALPLGKTLARRFRASRATVTRALRILDQSQWIHKQGTKLVAGPAIAGKPLGNHSVVLVGERLSFELLSTVRQNREFLSGFEAEIGRHGISISRVLGSGPQFYYPESMSTMGLNSLGTAYLLDFPRFMGFSSGITRLKAQLPSEVFSKGLPGILFGAGIVGNAATCYKARVHPNFFLFGANSKKAGQDTGMYLASLNHRSVAFFSYSDDSWNALRFVGLRQAMQRAWDTNASVCHFQVGADKTFLKKRSGSYVSEKVMQALKKTAQEIFGYSSFSRLSHVSRATVTELSHQISVEEHFHNLPPLFEKAWKEGKHTAWVCADPTVAIVAWHWLEKKGMNNRPSVISIDDHPNLVAQGITAYGFQHQQMGYLAAHCLLQDIQIKRNRYGVVDCPGQIVERGSVKKNV